MRTVTNISNVSDYSGETPISIPSNAVTTVITDPESTCPICCCEARCCCEKCSCCCCCDYDYNERCC